MYSAVGCKCRGGRRKCLVFICAVDGYGEKLVDGNAFSDSDGENIFAGRINVHVAEGELAVSGAKPADIAAACHFFIRNNSRLTGQFTFFSLKNNIILPAGSADIELVNQRRGGGDNLVVAKVVLEVFYAPFGKRVRVECFVTEACGQVLTGEGTV